MRDFDKGAFAKPRDSFPFVNVGEIKREREALTIGQGGHDTWLFTVKIQMGTKNYEGDTAYVGTDTVKGILDLMNDVGAVCRLNFFDGAFTRPCEVIAEETDTGLASDSTIVWVCETTITGRRREQRNAR